MKRRKLNEGDKVTFVSGNFQGLTGIVTKLNFNAINKEAIFGYYHSVLLSDGRLGYIEKGEHWRYTIV